MQNPTPFIFALDTGSPITEASAEGRLASAALLVGHDALDDFGVTLFAAQELTDAAFPCPYVCQKFLKAFDATVCEGRDPPFGAVVYPDHLAIVDVVRIGADDLDEFEALNQTWFTGDIRVPILLRY